MSLQVSVHRDFVAVRDESLKMIHSAFSLLQQEFQKLDRYVLTFTRLIPRGLGFKLALLKLFSLLFFLPARRLSWRELPRLCRGREKLTKFTNNNRNRFSGKNRTMHTRALQKYQSRFVQQSLVEGCCGRSPTQKIFTASSFVCRCSERTQKNKTRSRLLHPETQTPEAFYICVSGAAGNGRETPL